MSFAELCEAPLGSADYLALATRFRVLGIEGVPELDDGQHNAARRLGESAPRPAAARLARAGTAP